MNTRDPDVLMGVLSAAELDDVRSLLPKDVLLLDAGVEDRMDEIHPAERDIVRHAVPGRCAEFSTGRFLAARACHKLGAAAAPILRGAMNEPIWPQGVTGSITHTRDTCLVAVAPSDRIGSLGIDIEATGRNVADLAHLILRPDERADFPAQLAAEDGRVRLVFGAKESLYKAIHPQAGRFIDFQEARIEIGPERGGYSASAPDDRDLDALIQGGLGRYLIAERAVFTVWYKAP